MQAMARMTDLPTALMLARQLARRDRHLGSALMLGHKSEPAPAERRQLQESRASSSEPTTESAVQVSAQMSSLPDIPALGEEGSVQEEFPHADTGSNTIETIPNPPIPGEPVPSINALFAEVNTFAKAHGFGIIKANGVIRPGQRSRYVFNVTDTERNDLEGVLAFGSENLESQDASGRLWLRRCQRTAPSGLCNTFQIRNTTNTITSPVLMLPLTQFIGD